MRRSRRSRPGRSRRRRRPQRPPGSPSRARTPCPAPRGRTRAAPGQAVSDCASCPSFVPPGVEGSTTSWRSRVAFELLYDDTQSFDLDGIPDSGNASGNLGHDPAERVGVHLDGRAEPLVELVDGDPRIDPVAAAVQRRRPAAPPSRTRRRSRRRSPRAGPRSSQDPRYRRTRRRRSRCGSRAASRRAAPAPAWSRGRRTPSGRCATGVHPPVDSERGKQVLRVQHASDVVEGLVIDRQTRVARLLDQLDRLGGGRRVRQTGHVGARHHDLTNDLLGEVRDRLEQRPPRRRLVSGSSESVVFGLDTRPRSPREGRPRADPR